MRRKQTKTVTIHVPMRKSIATGVRNQKTNKQTNKQTKLSDSKGEVMMHADSGYPPWRVWNTGKAMLLRSRGTVSTMD